MDEFPTGPGEVPPAASGDPAWGPPSPNYPPPAGGYPPPGYVPPTQYPPYTKAAGPSTNTIAALAYITFIPALIFLVIEPYKHNDFIRFHSWQCIVLTLVEMAGSIIFGFMGTIGMMIRAVLGLLLFVFWLIAIIKASKGERYHIPIVGELAETLAATV
ncbi:MAG: DUF4870 domain-containing protein [Acidobacteria bacterium]|nr:DUF4870 domain-containing protein [Acidobacteriota bacterium]